MNIYWHTWRRGFDFAGRSSRKEYWTFTIITGCAIYGLLALALTGNDYTQMFLVLVVAALALFGIIPALSVTVRRLRDAGLSTAPLWVTLSVTLIHRLSPEDSPVYFVMGIADMIMSIIMVILLLQKSVEPGYASS